MSQPVTWNILGVRTPIIIIMDYSLIYLILYNLYVL